MQKFTNENIVKMKKKRTRNFFIFLVMIVVGFALIGWGVMEDEKEVDNVVYLDEIITSKDENKKDKKAYLNAQTIPYLFAGYKNSSNGYYIVGDEEFLYIVYMSKIDFENLNKEEIYDTPIRIEGITKETTKDVRNLAIEAYNEEQEDEKDKLTTADFENYFGSVYLDMTAKLTETASPKAVIPMVAGLILALTGQIAALAGGIGILRFRSAEKKLGESGISELDKEMNDKEAFYYKKSGLYLTDRYIINFIGTLRATKYEDVLWMYRYELRQNGVKTQQSIKIYTKDGKTYVIATTPAMTKNQTAVYEEIWNTIATKNPNMRLGYTKENIQAMREKAKEIKSMKKMK